MDKKETADLVRQSVRLIISFVGAVVGSALTILTFSLLKEFNIGQNLNSVIVLAIHILGAVLFGILFYFLSPRIIRSFRKVIAVFERSLSDMPLVDMISGTVGLIIGLLLAFLISTLVMKIPLPGINITLTIIIYIILGVLGWSIGSKRSRELKMFDIVRKNKDAKEKQKQIPAQNGAKAKVLDTSVIIDGRIFDICKTGIIEGEIVIPGFVLQELRHISDSSDGLKRNRGRRGLDILNKIQKELDVDVRIEERDYDDIDEVDEKLLKLAQDLNGVVVTNDYNLDKVAAVHEISVLNINELANAVKPVVMPGEEMKLVILKVGKEAGQGIAYLDDGTMIVVEGGKKYLGEPVDVIVTSVLQTSAGRMIFAKMK